MDRCTQTVLAFYSFPCIFNICAVIYKPEFVLVINKHACLCRDKIFEVNVKIGCVAKIIVDLLDILWCVFLQILAKLVILIIDPVILIYIIVE